MSSEKPKRSNRRLIVFAIIGVIAACGIISVLTSLFSDGSTTADPEPTAAVVDEVVVPTDIPEPAQPPPTELPPTDIPDPTAVPVPTVAPTEEAAGESAEELAYRLSIVDIFGRYGEAIGGITTQSIAVGEQPARMFDEDWILLTAAYLASIRVENDALRALNPPTKFQEVHSELLVAADHYDTMTTLYAAGVDEVSPDKLSLATESMLLGSEAIQRATDLIIELNTP